MADCRTTRILPLLSFALLIITARGNTTHSLTSSSSSTAQSPPTSSSTSIRGLQNEEPSDTSSASTTDVTETSTDAAGNGTNPSPPEEKDGFLRCGQHRPAALAIGDDFILCVFLGLQPPRKMMFKIKVDEHASLVLRNSTGLVQRTTSNASSGDTVTESPTIHTWLSTTQAGSALPLNCSNGAHDGRSHFVSCPQAYFGPDRVVEFLSVVVNLEDGLVHSFVWDTPCKGCSSSSVECMPSSRALDSVTFAGEGGLQHRRACARDRGSCPQGIGDCDLRIFVTFAGTDKDKHNARSAGQRISRFTSDALSSMSDSVTSW